MLRAAAIEVTSDDLYLSERRQALRDRGYRYHDEGLAGLTDRHSAVGFDWALSPEQEAAVTDWVRRGPDLAEYGVLR